VLIQIPETVAQLLNDPRDLRRGFGIRRLQQLIHESRGIAIELLDLVGDLACARN